MSGALAEAESARPLRTSKGCQSAFYWTYPKADSPVIERISRVPQLRREGGDASSTSRSPRGLRTGTPRLSSLSRDDAGTHVVLVLLNFAPDSAARAPVALDGCGRGSVAQRVHLRGGRVGRLTPVEGWRARQGASIEEILAPYSITVVDLHLQTPAPGALEK
jgi:hypothetical protein